MTISVMVFKVIKRKKSPRPCEPRSFFFVSVKTKKAVFLLIAADAADESKKNYKKLAEYYRIPYAEGLDREKLGRCLGKEYRAAAVLTDAGFAGKLRQLMEESI